ncbi:hypothetical protein CF327_g6385 [Tilletia walkeri]|nr:hypothetical protein CF327_g6385 [Tilletia walkeri]
MRATLRARSPEDDAAAAAPAQQPAAARRRQIVLSDRCAGRSSPIPTRVVVRCIHKLDRPSLDPFLPFLRCDLAQTLAKPSQLVWTVDVLSPSASSVFATGSDKIDPAQRRQSLT